MPLRRSRRWDILKYLEEVGRATRRQVAEAFGLTYWGSRYHLEKLVEALYLEKGVEQIGKLRRVWYIYREHIGISITYNAKTGGERKPLLDITLTVQTVIARVFENEWIEKVNRLASIWFTEKFGEGQTTGMFGVARRPDPAVDYWTPDYEQIRKFSAIYYYTWTWSRTTETRRREGHCEGYRKKVPEPEEIPVECEEDPTRWSTSKRGRPPIGE